MAIPFPAKIFKSGIVTSECPIFFFVQITSNRLAMAIQPISAEIPISSCPVFPMLFKPTMASDDELRRYCGKGTDIETGTGKAPKCVVTPQRSGDCPGSNFYGTEADCNALGNGCTFQEKSFSKFCSFDTRMDNRMKPNNNLRIQCGKFIGFWGGKHIHAKNLCGPGTTFREQNEADPLGTNQCELT